MLESDIDKRLSPSKLIRSFGSTEFLMDHSAPKASFTPFPLDSLDIFPGSYSSGGHHIILQSTLTTCEVT